jgi:hypothetical protein
MGFTWLFPLGTVPLRGHPAIVGGDMSSSVQAELDYALAKRKLVIPIVQQGALAGNLRTKFPQVFEFSPWNTGDVEKQVVDFLKRQKISKDNQQALAALVAIGLGLFALLALTEK